MVHIGEIYMQTKRPEWPDKFVTNLDWNLLRTFVVIVQEGSITAAATRLLLRQPTISLALQRLEYHMGNRLIERGRGTFRLTAVGRELYRECVDIYGGIAQLKDVASSATQEITGEIRIVLASHVITPLYDELLASFHVEHAKVTYKINIDTSIEVARQVLDKSASLGICLLNKKLPQLNYEIIYREFFGFYCGPPHPLFGKENLQIEDLRDHVAVSFGTDDLADALRPVALLRRQHELGQQIVGQSQHLEEVKRMIMCGLGIGPLPVHVVERDVRDGLLWRLPPYDDPPAVDIYLVTNPRKRHNQAETRFIEALVSRIADLPMSERTYF
jgi:DNA-binding transcriptional LysR family regulator